MKQDLLLTPKERDTLWERYEKEYPLQDIDWDDIICQAQLAKADPQGAYNRGFEQGKFEERQRIIGIIDNKMDEQRRNYEHTAELHRGFPYGKTFSIPMSIFAICSVGEPEPTSRLYLAWGSLSCSKNILSRL